MKTEFTTKFIDMMNGNFKGNDVEKSEFCKELFTVMAEFVVSTDERLNSFFAYIGQKMLGEASDNYTDSGVIFESIVDFLSDDNELFKKF